MQMLQWICVRKCFIDRSPTAQSLVPPLIPPLIPPILRLSFRLSFQYLPSHQTSIIPLMLVIRRACGLYLSWWQDVGHNFATPSSKSTLQLDQEIQVEAFDPKVPTIITKRVMKKFVNHLMPNVKVKSNGGASETPGITGGGMGIVMEGLLRYVSLRSLSIVVFSFIYLLLICYLFV